LKRARSLLTEAYIYVFIKGNVILKAVNHLLSYITRSYQAWILKGDLIRPTVKGFIRINAIRLMAHRAIVEASAKKNGKNGKITDEIARCLVLVEKENGLRNEE
jgi:hypothetical protein